MMELVVLRFLKYMFYLFELKLIPQMLFYFQQIYWFHLFSYDPIYAVNQPLYHATTHHYCLVYQFGRAALRWPFLCINCSYQPVFIL